MAKWTKCAWKMPDNERDILIWDGRKIQSGFYNINHDVFFANTNEMSRILSPLAWSEMPPLPRF